MLSMTLASYARGVERNNKFLATRNSFVRVSGPFPIDYSRLGFLAKFNFLTKFVYFVLLLFFFIIIIKK